MPLNTDHIFRDLSAIRTKGPLIHNITNHVVMNVTANALLACGASPVMAHAVEEMEEMAAIASALILNIGTLSAPWITAMEIATRVARDRAIPIIIDPVGAGATSFRTSTALNLISQAGSPIIRGNGSEILALTSSAAKTKGVDSTVASTNAVEAAKHFASENRSIISISGETDYITDGKEVLEVRGGSDLMTRITGMGCTASALTGAFAAVNTNRLEAAAHAMAIMSICGGLAAAGAAGPASMQTRFLDQLHTLSEEDIRKNLA